MKTTFISFIAVIMICMTAMSFTNSATDKNTILIQAVDNQTTSTALSESAAIITARLKDFSTETFDVTIIPDKKQIQVAGIPDKDILNVRNLITKKGAIGFYKVYNRTELSELLKGDQQLFSLLNSTDLTKRDPCIGWISVSKIDKVNEYLNAMRPSVKFKTVWSDSSDSSKISLYALRLEPVTGSLLSGNDLDSVKCSRNGVHDNWYISFNFKMSVVKKWADITHDNIGNSIAIVIDNKVMCAPTVNTTIESGKCQITGNFTETDVKLFRAVWNHGELPVLFKVAK